MWFLDRMFRVGMGGAMVRRIGMVLGMVLGLGPVPAWADTITLRADEWCPANCAPGDKPGYGVEAATEIFAKAGHKVEYAVAPWGRSLEDCLHGTIDAVIGAAPVDSPDLVFPEQPIGVWDTTFVVAKGRPWRYTGADSLPAVKLGGIIGYIYMEPVGAYVEANKGDRNKVDLVGARQPLEQNLRKLVAGRIGATMEARTVLDYNLRELGLQDAVDFAGSTEGGSVYIAFSPKHPKAREYARILDEGLREMRASGRLKQILDRYGVKDWK
jgi:ABC-type amino acid transport/signal transduction systems, periplasmic component/domain